MVDYWRTEYDWRAAEAAINKWPQFTTEIDGANDPFPARHLARTAALPLLLTHGWPGSFVEFLDLIGPLSDPAAHGGDAGRRVPPRDPQPPRLRLLRPRSTSGWDNDHVARAWAELMRRLGYDRYGVQGGDIGADVSPAVGRADPDTRCRRPRQRKPGHAHGRDQRRRVGHYD